MNFHDIPPTFSCFVPLLKLYILAFDGNSLVLNCREQFFILVEVIEFRALILALFFWSRSSLKDFGDLIEFMLVAFVSLVHFNLCVKYIEDVKFHRVRLFRPTRSITKL